MKMGCKAGKKSVKEWRNMNKGYGAGSSSVLKKISPYVVPVAADAKSYVLISQLPADIYKACVEDEKKSRVIALTFVVTSIVKLAGGKINEENLWHQLRRLGLSETDESHPVHGNVKLALEAIVQQRYLHKEKVNGPERFLNLLRGHWMSQLMME